MLKLELLGPVSLRDDSGTELDRLIGQPKRFALLAYLAGNAPRVYHRRDRILGLFWPDATAEQARHGLRQLLYELRNHLGQDVLLRRGAEEIALNREQINVDVALFEGALKEGDLPRAIELYRGEFMDGVFLTAVPELMDWMESRRRELKGEVSDAARRLAEVRHSEGDRSGAVAAARRVVDWTPTDEVGVRRLIELLWEDGNTGEALRAHEHLSRTLAEDLDVEPSAQTEALVARIREAASDLRALPPEPAPFTARPDARQSDAPQPISDPPPPTLSPASAEAVPRFARAFLTLRPIAAATVFGVLSLAVMIAVSAAMIQLGLPGWVLRATVGLLIVGLPIVVATAVSERGSRAGGLGIGGWLTWRRAVQGGVFAFATLAAFTAGFMGARARGIGPAATLISSGVLEPRSRVLIADFVNHTADSTLARTLTDLLRIDLSQSRAVRLVDPATVTMTLQRMVVGSDAPMDGALAREVAERAGAPAVLAGSVAALGSGFALSATLTSSVDGTLLAAERVTARGEDGLINAVDRLSAGIREKIGESLKDVRSSPPLESVTTTSLAALRQYSLAMGPAGLQDGQRAGVRLLQEAIELDPNFAMAYRGLGIFLNRTGRPEEAHAAVRGAYELRDHLPEVERHLVTALYHTVVEFDAETIEQAYESALALEPDNYLALINLASHVSLTRQWAVREELALKSLGSPGSFVGFLNAFQALLLQGKIDEAEQLARSTSPTGDLNPNRASDLASARGDYDGAELALRAGDRFTDRDRAVDVLSLRGRFNEAEQLAMSRNADGLSPDLGTLSRVASLRVDRGMGSAAVDLLAAYPADALPVLRRRYLQRAELFAQAGRAAEARTLLSAYQAQVEPVALEFPFSQARMGRAAGEIALAEHRFLDAVEEFGRVYDLSGQCARCGLARRGLAWQEAGEPDSALSTYERLLEIPPNGLERDDARWLPDVFLSLGELYDARQDTAAALANYAAFVELWNEADPQQQPRVARARARMKSLEAGGGGT